MQENDLSFLNELWHHPEVMRFANEFPRLRGWSRKTIISQAWKKYQEKREVHGCEYSQLILHLEDGTSIGESFMCPLPESYCFGRWTKPNSVRSCIGDIKLLPQYWGKGLGTKGMRLIVQFVFTKTKCELFVVPPHRHNPAAIRVYEKAGFVHFKRMRSWRNHKIMELSKKRFQEFNVV